MSDEFIDFGIKFIAKAKKYLIKYQTVLNGKKTEVDALLNDLKTVLQNNPSVLEKMFKEEKEYITKISKTRDIELVIGLIDTNTLAKKFIKPTLKPIFKKLFDSFTEEEKEDIWIRLEQFLIL
jgi:vacuolar-type H+-ATPase subunit E/Vma4